MSPFNVRWALALVPLRPAVQVEFAGAGVAALGRFGCCASRTLSRACGVTGSGVALVSVLAWWFKGFSFSSSFDIVSYR